MEVHHPHHVGHKKKWNELLLEFFMLFLAITLGFFAENQRESYVERHREKQYMQSLLEDLKKDTAEFNAVKKSYIKQVGRLDSSIVLFRTKHYDKETLKTLYVLNLGTLGNRSLNLSERTTTQLKNAGGMRLIENHKISDLIASYWRATEYIQAYANTTEELKVRGREKSYSIFDQGYYENIQRGAVNTTVTDDVKLMTYDHNTLTEYTNRLSHVKNSIKNVQLFLLDNNLKIANELLTEIPKEYNIKH